MKKVLITSIFIICMTTSFYVGMRVAYAKSAKGWYISHVGNYGSASEIKFTLEINP